MILKPSYMAVSTEESIAVSPVSCSQLSIKEVNSKQFTKWSSEVERYYRNTNLDWGSQISSAPQETEESIV